MSTSATETEPRVTDVRCTDDTLTVTLDDGRSITRPLKGYPRLAAGTAEQQANWRVAGAGHGIHWPELDEDLSVEGLLAGRPAGPGTA